MTTLQEITMRTEYMMEVIRQNAIDATFKKFKEASRRYYENGCDNGETVALIKELERLGANMDMVFDIDFEIRDEVCGV